MSFFQFSLWFTDFRSGLLHVNSGKTSHSRENSKSHATSRTFEVQSARPHVDEVHEQRDIILTQGGLGGGGRSPPQRQSKVYIPLFVNIFLRFVLIRVQLGYVTLGQDKLGCEFGKNNMNKLCFKFKFMCPVQVSEQSNH